MPIRPTARALALVVFVAAPSLSQTPTSADITAQDVHTRTYIIADDSMEGREATTPGNISLIVASTTSFSPSDGSTWSM